MPVVKVKSSSSTDIYLEVSETFPVAQTKAAPKNVLDTFEKVGQSIADVCADIFAKVNLNDLAPDELTLEFSLSIGADLSVLFVAKSSGEGTFKVSATWNKPKPVRKTARPKTQS
jgi:hypothetical protein